MFAHAAPSTLNLYRRSSMPRHRTPKVEYTCTHCGTCFLRWASHVRCRVGPFCSSTCKGAAFRRSAESRFLQNIGNPTSTGCLPWLGTKHNAGYGVISERIPCKRTLLAHRYAWTRRFGSIPPGLHVLHRCDNPPCVNVDHLFLGTQADNVADMVSKSRQAKGRQNPRTKLTPAAVREIRLRYVPGRVTQQGLADKFHVSATTISEIVARKYWTQI